MTSTRRELEAEQTSAVFQLALAQLGISTVADALKLWGTVPPVAQAAQSAAWLDQAVHLVLTRRVASRALAMSYYRLVRALRTGRTIADPAHRTPPSVTLGELRREFAVLAGNPKPSPAEVAPGTPAPPAAQPAEGDDERIGVEKLDGLVNDHARLERSAQDEADEVLEMLGTRNLEHKVAAIDTSRPADQVDAQRAEAHQRAGTRQAAAAERLVINGARGVLWSNADRDRRVIGYARVSRTGTPCGWCAMLISRGAVYKSKRGATYSDGDKYHDNCHCYAEPLFSQAQYTSDAKFDLNRDYEGLWPTVTAGTAGKDALAVWRRYFRAQQKASALEARSTP